MADFIVDTVSNANFCVKTSFSLHFSEISGNPFF